MKFYLSLATFILTTFSFDGQAQFHRFYRGYAHAQIGPNEFETIMNKDFFPLFPKAGVEGLIAYRPVILNEEKHLNIPQEIALLTFKDEETYKTYGNSEIGKTIRAAHGPVFDANRSKSLVPLPYEGKVAYENAYLLNPEFKDFKTGVSGVLIVAQPFGTPDSTLKELEKIFKSTRKENIISLVAENLVIEYLFAANESQLEKLRKTRCSLFKGAFKTTKFVPLTKHKVGDKVVKLGEGMDAQF